MYVRDHFQSLFPELFDLDNGFLSMEFKLIPTKFQGLLPSILLDYISKLSELYFFVSEKEEIDDDEKLFKDYVEEVASSHKVIDKVMKLNEIDTLYVSAIIGSFHTLLDKICVLPDKYLVINEVRESITCIALFADSLLTTIHTTTN